MGQLKAKATSNRSSELPSHFGGAIHGEVENLCARLE